MSAGTAARSRARQGRGDRQRQLRRQRQQEQPQPPDPGPAPRAAGLARHAAWNHTATAASLACSLVIMALAFRELPAADVGIYSVAVATMALLAGLDQAVGLAVSRGVSRGLGGLAKTEESSAALRAAQAMLVAGAAAALTVGAAALGLTAALDRSALPGWQGWVMAAGLLLALVVRLPTAILPAVANGRRDFRSLGSASLLASLVSLALVATLLPSLGLAALGLSQLVGLLVSRLLLIPPLRRSGGLPRLLVRHAPRDEVREVAGYAGPALLLALAAQAITWSDLVLVSGLVGPGASGLYRVAALVPTQLASLLYQGYDVVFPLLTRNRVADQMRFSRLLLTVFSAGAGVAFAGVLWTSGDVVSIFTGGRDPLAVTVLMIFCGVWALNVPNHGLSLLLMAQGLQRRIVRIVLVEAAANVVLTVVLVLTVGAWGAALATLVTLGISNVVVMPLALRRDLPGAVSLTLRCGLLPLVVSGGLTVLALLAVSGLAHGWAGFSVDAVLAVALGIAAAAIAGGPAGRRALRDSLARSG
jgi:O-antigen/teichoic acid export membrane protein